MKFLLLVVLSVSTLAYSGNLEDRIKDMRLKYQAEKQRADLIEKLENEQKLINAYVAIVSARRKCEEMGIDCSKGEGVESVGVKLKNIEEEKKLINAYISLKEERKKCKTAGINCDTGKTLPKNKKVKKVTFNKKTDKLPTKPIVIGYIKGAVLLQTESGQIKSYKKGDTLANGYVITTVNHNQSVELEYKGKKIGFIE